MEDYVKERGHRPRFYQKRKTPGSVTLGLEFCTKVRCKYTV